MNRAYYSDRIAAFLDCGADTVVGRLVQRSAFAVEATQRDAWLKQIGWRALARPGAELVADSE